MSDGDERSERLRERRSKTREKAEQSEPSKPSEPAETDESDEPAEKDKPSVKDERSGTYMYLPESQKAELGPTFKILSAEYEREFGDELEKNRHFYPLVVQYGLDGLDGLNASEIKERLDELQLLD